MPKTTARRRQIDRERARHKIVSAATDLFATRGLQDVTYGDIARRSRLSRPLIYFYFPTPEELIQETFVVACGRLQERFQNAIAGTKSGCDAVEAIGRAYLQFHEDCPSEARLMMLEGAQCHPSGPSGSATARLMDQKKDIIALVAAQVERGRADGSIRRDDSSPVVVALNLWAFVHGLGQLRSQLGWAIEGVHGVSLADFVTHGFRLIGEALQAHPEKN